MLTFTQTVAPLNVLSSRAMLASLRISAWSARRIDKAVTADTNSRLGAAADAGRYNKVLIARDALAAITQAATAARTLHYAKTLPWLDDGARLLPAKAHLDYTREMQGLRMQFEQAVSDFLTAYPALIADAQQRLGAMFNRDEYPEPCDINSKFSFTVRCLPVPDARDFRVELGDAAAAEIRAEIERATVEALNIAQRDVFERIADVVGRMSERLRAYQPASRKGQKVEGIFRDSLVENVRDLVSLLPTLNLTGDQRLAQIAQQMHDTLCPHDAEALRTDEHLRNETAAAAEAILADVADFLA